MILRTLLHTARQYKLFPPDRVVILAVSGGVDSLAMLHALVELRPILGCQWHVATLDHGLRGAEGAADAAFVAQVCRDWDVPCTAGRVDVPQLMHDWQTGLEAAARRARYQFLAGVAQTHDTTTIATAHHQDDQAETILMHLLRGAGAEGIIGMTHKAPLPDHPGLVLVRPLLNLSRSDLEAYCIAQGLQPRHDQTNQDRAHLRNALRLDVLPALREINPNLNDALIQTADVVQAQHAFIREYYNKHIVPHLIVAPRRVQIAHALFVQQHPALQRETLRQAAKYLGLELAYAHIVAAVDLCLTSSVGKQLAWPAGFRVRLGYDTIYIEAEDLPLPDEVYVALHQPTTVQIPGKTLLDGWILHATIQEPAQYDAQLTIPDGSQVRLRTRQAGDRLRPMGMGGQSQKLKKWLIDHKVPRHLRDSIPLLMVEDAIAAIILSDQWVIAEPHAVSSSSQRIVYFSISKLL